MRVVAAAFPLLLAASPAAAYLIRAESIGAGGWEESAVEGTVEIGNAIGDASGNLVDGYAMASGESGGLSGSMLIEIANWLAAQSSNVTDFTVEKSWKSLVTEEIHDFVLDPGAPELVVRLRVSATDESHLEPAPLPSFDNGYARAHLWARLRYYNAHPHGAEPAEVIADGRADRNVPDDWTANPPDDVVPAGYGTTSAGAGYGNVEIRIPASEVDPDDYLLVSAQLWGEVQGGHWSGAFAKSQLSSGGTSLEILGGDGVPQNPIFLSVPEPGAPLLGGFAIAALALTARRKRNATNRR